MQKCKWKHLMFPVFQAPMVKSKDIHEAYVIAKKIGYPVLLKAASGGGGIGMKIVPGDDH